MDFLLVFLFVLALELVFVAVQRDGELARRDRDVRTPLA